MRLGRLTLALGLAFITVVLVLLSLGGAREAAPAATVKVATAEIVLQVDGVVTTAIPEGRATSVDLLVTLRPSDGGTLRILFDNDGAHGIGATGVSANLVLTPDQSTTPTQPLNTPIKVPNNVSELKFMGVNLSRYVTKGKVTAKVIWEAVGGNPAQFTKEHDITFVTQPKPSYEVAVSVKNEDGTAAMAPRTRTKGTTFNVSIAVKASTPGMPNGTWDIEVLPNRVTRYSGIAISAPQTVTLAPSDRGPIAMVAVFKPTSGQEVFASQPFPLEIDTEGPVLDRVEVIGGGDLASVLAVTFRDADLPAKERLKRASFQIIPAASSAAVDDRYMGDFTVERNVVKIPLIQLPSGTYKLRVRGKGIAAAPAANGAAGTKPTESAANAIADDLGNEATGDQDREFVIFPGRQYGPHVPFPPFVPPAPVPTPKDGFNPNDFVVTRVARLYYYRDAHRVAQILNRNVRSYNMPAVAQARQRAEESRRQADERTDERRHLEREAVTAAQDMRRIEGDLARARQDLVAAGQAENRQAAADANFELANRSVLQRNAEIQEIDTRLINIENALKSTQETPPETRANLEKERQGLQLRKQALAADRDAAAIAKTQAGEQSAVLRRQVQGIGSTKELQGKIRDLETQLNAARGNAIKKNEESLQAQAREDRARQEQFRKEVAAAHEDPDTYVPGEIHSVDSLTQTSISVIGEGLIQLRGPIKGVNKIRIAINQIDSPVGQVKVGIHSIQVNGEKADRMEKTLQRIESALDNSRFLTSQSMMLLRRAVVTVASQVAAEAERSKHFQVDRDRKYLYSFFGRDFIDELYAMDSEFLRTENKILCLNSMDTISLNRSLFIMALARNDIRQRILATFLELAKTELPEAEYEFRSANKSLPWFHAAEKLFDHAGDTYHFRNLRSFFDAPGADPNIMTPMQREFIRLAQIFKSQMLAEMEWKQRVIERALIEDRSNDDRQRQDVLEKVHGDVLAFYEQSLRRQARAPVAIDIALKMADDELINRNQQSTRYDRAFQVATAVRQDLAARATTQTKKPVRLGDIDHEVMYRGKDLVFVDPKAVAAVLRRELDDVVNTLNAWNTQGIPAASRDDLPRVYRNVESLRQDVERMSDTVFTVASHYHDVMERMARIAYARGTEMLRVIEQFLTWKHLILSALEDMPSIRSGFQELVKLIKEVVPAEGEQRRLLVPLQQAYDAVQSGEAAKFAERRAQELAKKTRGRLDHRKLLDNLIDEKEDKYIELVEGTRAHIASVDNYLKRLAIAIEDDCKVQFYDPAFAKVRRAGVEWDVTMGQIERTTILTNNRAFAKVEPQATMEFDLPERDIVIAEAMNGAKALAQDMGMLLKDPAFLAATDMLGGSPTTTTAASPLPVERSALTGLPSSSQELLFSQGSGNVRKHGAALEALIPGPAVYKFETGTGFEIRPVIQPDGDSIVYDFNFLYTTNVREPVQADEKHLGRIKRHFVHTQVQTSSFELREISRYLVQLKAARTAQGVPLLQDVPVLGTLFRPLPSAESALQQNLILGESTVYPTLFDLMGLRWAPHVVDLDHRQLKDLEHVTRGRAKTIENYVFDEASDRVDEFLELNTPQWQAKGLHRPDLYRQQRAPSPHHPGGYVYPESVEDPTGRQFHREDPRPREFQQPMQDPLRGEAAQPERIRPGIRAEPIPSAGPRYLPQPPPGWQSGAPSGPEAVPAPRPDPRGPVNATPGELPPPSQLQRRGPGGGLSPELLPPRNGAQPGWQQRIPEQGQSPGNQLQFRRRIPGDGPEPSSMWQPSQPNGASPVAGPAVQPAQYEAPYQRGSPAPPGAFPVQQAAYQGAPPNSHPRGTMMPVGAMENSSMPFPAAPQRPWQAGFDPRQQATPGNPRPPMQTLPITTPPLTTRVQALPATVQPLPTWQLPANPP